MKLPRLRRLIATHLLEWCLAGLFLAAIQPFLFSHFRQDGWEDEPGFRVRNAQSTALFSPDDRASHAKELETTLYAPAGAHLESHLGAYHALLQGLAQWLSLLPLMAVAGALLRPPESPVPRPVRHTGGAPPRATPWCTLPPSAAPPLPT
ncbi:MULTISPECIES: hypothetical protein [unclassified Variovorax]|uniref:hypothetical protein n=1 Tax=unclassified Variovorax TaxID=663243 RepID=UPI0025779483|nr:MULTISPECIES: hypothetical protein [unclassified Variovorax]MDM0086330.1 hypothetical protein [Variovorax sp. J22G40]MDM0145413.1 hypothetical protein [Variovorax sp. J2P1-31]